MEMKKYDYTIEYSLDGISGLVFETDADNDEEAILRLSIETDADESDIDEMHRVKVENECICKQQGRGVKSWCCPEHGRQNRKADSWDAPLSFKTQEAHENTGK